MAGIGYTSAYKGEIQKSTLKFPEKYADDKPIIFRSKLEYDYFMAMDLNPNVLLWASENIEIPYIGNPLKESGKLSRYFPDLMVKLKQGDTFRNLLIEIKPQSELDAVLNMHKLKTNSKQFYRAIQNHYKWQQADEFCKKQTIKSGNQWNFIVLTERDLKRMRGK